MPRKKKAPTPQPKATPKARRVGKPKKGTEPIPPERYDELASLYFTGYGVEQLAEHFGVRRNTIQNRLDQILPLYRQSPFENSLEFYCQAIMQIWRTCWERFRSDAPFEREEHALENVFAEFGHDKKTKQDLKRILVGKRQTKQKFRPGQIGWLQLALECLVQIAKMRGLSEDVSRVEVSYVLRYAGMSPDEIDREVLARIESAVVETSAYCEALEQPT